MSHLGIDSSDAHSGRGNHVSIFAFVYDSESLDDLCERIQCASKRAIYRTVCVVERRSLNQTKLVW